MPVNPPTPQEVAWRERVRDTGSILSGKRPIIQIHHPAGRTAKHNKQFIGHRFILPLSASEHRLVDEGRSGLMELKEYYWGYHGSWDFDKVMLLTLHEFEKYLFAKLCTKLPFPFDDDIFEAIMDWHR